MTMSHGKYGTEMLQEPGEYLIQCYTNVLKDYFITLITANNEEYDWRSWKKKDCCHSEPSKTTAVKRQEVLLAGSSLIDNLYAP